MSSKDRVIGLDALRFFAALWVVSYHYGFRGFTADSLTQLPPPALFQGWAKYGYLGVELFFMISGFVILMTAGKGNLRSFLISRVIRLYPAFWFCCTLSWGVSILLGGARYSSSFPVYLANMSMVSGFFDVPLIDSVYWTLLVEIKFYFLIAIVLVFRQMRRIELLLGLWLLFALAAQTGLSPFRYTWKLLMPDFAPYFIGGAVCYLLYARGSSAYRLLVLAASFAAGALNAVVKVPEMERHFLVEFSPAVVGSLILGIYIVVWRLPLISKLPVNRWAFAWMGALSYPVYLLHQNIGFMIFDRAYPIFSAGLTIGVVTMLVTAVSAFTHVWIERKLAPRIRNILERFYPASTQAITAGS